MVTIVIANSMQFAFYIIPTARKYKQLTSNQLNMNIEKIYKVHASVEIFTFVRSKSPICRLLCYIMYVRYIMCSFTTNANDMAL